MDPALRVRNWLGRKLVRSQVATPFSIISDDCWGSQIYRHLELPYATPTVGLYIEPSEYIDFITNLHQADAADLNFVPSIHRFPVAETPYARIFFMHYATEAEARDKFTRRFRRILFDRLLVKIDFGKAGYGARDIARWNALRFPGALALYPPQVGPRQADIFRGVQVADWVLDGAAMFDRSRKYFDFRRWIAGRGVGRTRRYRLLNFLLLDPSAPGRLKSLRRKIT
jgi:uncharacterized protein (DUF1919 family)